MNTKFKTRIFKSIWMNFVKDWKLHAIFITLWIGILLLFIFQIDNQSQIYRPPGHSLFWEYPSLISNAVIQQNSSGLYGTANTPLSFVIKLFDLVIGMIIIFVYSFSYWKINLQNEIQKNQINIWLLSSYSRNKTILIKGATLLIPQFFMYLFEFILIISLSANAYDDQLIFVFLHLLFSFLVILLLNVLIMFIFIIMNTKVLGLNIILCTVLLLTIAGGIVQIVPLDDKNKNFVYYLTWFLKHCSIPGLVTNVFNYDDAFNSAPILIGDINLFIAANKEVNVIEVTIKNIVIIMTIPTFIYFAFYFFQKQDFKVA